jgi:hypothetical protein
MSTSTSSMAMINMLMLPIKNLFTNDILLLLIKPIHYCLVSHLLLSTITIWMMYSNIHQAFQYPFNNQTSIHHQRGHCLNIQIHQYPNANSTNIAIVKLGYPKIRKNYEPLLKNLIESENK